MTVAIINKLIMVGAIFGKNGIIPKWFIHDNKRRDIKKVTYTWKSNTGESVIIQFSVSDGATLYEIGFNQKTVQWSLEKVEA